MRASIRTESDQNINHRTWHIFESRPKLGTEVAAIFYTLFETAKLSQVDPSAYVTRAARRAIAHPGAATLPSNLT